ncbi:DUF1488 domain-containing protein [Erwinia piriflorinigrans]|uniref:DUF1488 domain-containing protein n=1 Tax=Erwinia piriflorinigrans CFBP 5888 TaxID=1161919 RepID=V5ZBL5_9GAMM|nr:DUF1488 domain-containing protein [Erwinia piriflorinigrans]CCG88788.1 putative protein yrdB [Erwinia piriflorinigrans CFBP 5888]
MNQAIQFPEREWWDEARQAVCFSAQANGFQLTCAINGEELLRRFHKEGDALACFRLNRWELEELAERAIQHQQEDDQGWVWLSSYK